MATHHQGAADEVRALDAYIKLNRAIDGLRVPLARAMQEHGLTPAQLGVLEAVYHLGPLSLGDLSRKLLCSGANITVVVDNLEHAGLMVRGRGEADRRVVTVSLTPAGRKRIGKFFPEHARHVARLMSGLSQREQETLGRLCKKLGLSLKALTKARSP
jgi:MarR family transcriptional regulator, 2-MHQ and catechol-resistance regulon repressor